MGRNKGKKDIFLLGPGFDYAKAIHDAAKKEAVPDVIALTQALMVMIAAGKMVPGLWDQPWGSLVTLTPETGALVLRRASDLQVVRVSNKIGIQDSPMLALTPDANAKILRDAVGAGLVGKVIAKLRKGSSLSWKNILTAAFLTGAVSSGMVVKRHWDKTSALTEIVLEQERQNPAAVASVFDKIIKKLAPLSLLQRERSVAKIVTATLASVAVGAGLAFRLLKSSNTRVKSKSRSRSRAGRGRSLSIRDV